MRSTLPLRAGAFAGALSAVMATAGSATARAQDGPAPDAAASPPASSETSDPRPGARPVRVVVRTRRLQVMAGRRAAVTGRVRPGTAGLVVRLQVRRRRGWETVDVDRTSRSGRYALLTRRSATMSAPARLRISSRGAGLRVSHRNLGRLEVYRRASASWYGPGLYGNRLGCGGRLNAGSLGVAHKKLPCGTLVTFKRGSRSIRVRVIDRGPYVGGREYDLTAATARRLGFRGHGPIMTTG